MSDQARLSLAIRGVITLVAHAHQTSPEEGKDGEAAQLKTSVLTNAGAVAIPYITANSVRGMLRRAAGEVLMEQLQRDDGQISRNLYLSVMRGAFSRTGLQAGGGSYQQVIAAQNHPFVGLFGGGAYMYTSKLRIERDLLPMIEPIAHVFPQQFQAECLKVEPWRLLNKILMASRDDFSRLPTGDFIENAEEAYFEHMTAKLAGNRAKRAQRAQKAAGEAVVGEKATTTDLNGFNQVEAIVPGTRLYFGTTATDVTAAQAGLLCEAVRRWANRNAVGGGSARGRGAFTAALSLYVNGSRTGEHLLEGDSGDYALTAVAAPYTEALYAELAAGAARPAVLNAIYPTDIKMDPAAKPGRHSKPAEAFSE